LAGSRARGDGVGGAQLKQLDKLFEKVSAANTAVGDAETKHGERSREHKAALKARMRAAARYREASAKSKEGS
jgi:hypothetical protein